MNKTRHFLIPFLSLGLALVAACSPSDAPEAAESAQAPEAAESAAPAAAARSVRIVDPADGAEIQGSDLRVVLEVDGMMIRPAGDATANSGHHHLFLDADLSDPTVPVPSVPGSIVHMGDGSSEYVFEGVAPGTHRLIAVVADLAHIPLQPWVVDTISVVVR